MIIISLVIGAMVIALLSADMEFVGTSMGMGVVTLLSMVAWALYYLGFHRVLIERGYYGELGCLGIIGPLSLLALLSLPDRGREKRTSRDQP